MKKRRKGLGIKEEKSIPRHRNSLWKVERRENEYGTVSKGQSQIEQITKYTKGTS